MSTELYHPAEHLILSDLLEVPALYQPEVSEVSVDPESDHLRAVQELWGIKCTGIGNAVARPVSLPIDWLLWLTTPRI